MRFEKKKLGEICDDVGGIIQTGPFGSQLHKKDYIKDGIPVVMPQDIIDGSICIDNIARISQSDIERLRRHKLLEGDIIYGRRGDIGRRALIRERESGWLCGTGCLRVSMCKGPLDSEFLYYYLGQQQVIRWIYNQAIGATLPNLNTAIMRSVEISYPNRISQRKIATILSTYDKLIKNNLRRIKILEEMAQMIYQEWFVHFRFPGHEGVRMVDSQMGKIPEGWEVVQFTDVADVLSGGTPKTKVTEYWEGDIFLFTPTDMPDSFYVMDTEKTITDLGLSKCNSRLYPRDTVFITARGTVGNVVMTSIDMAMNQSCYALLGKDGITQLFLFLLTLDSTDYLKKNTGGATFGTIIVDTFRRLPVLRPTLDAIEKFERMIKPIFELIKNLLSKNKNLRRTRDLLLPKLISGKLDVSEIDIRVPEDEAVAEELSESTVGATV